MTMQFYFVVRIMHGMKDSDSKMIMIINHESRPVVWSGRYITL